MVRTSARQAAAAVTKRQREQDEPSVSPPPVKRRTKAGTKAKAEPESEPRVEAKPEPKTKTKPTKRTEADSQPQDTAASQPDQPEDGSQPKKRKTKEQKAAEAMPLASRTLNHALVVGAHVSGAGGVHNSVDNALHIGANAFALFLKSQRKWANPPLDPKTAALFHGQCKAHSYDQARHAVPHGSYLVNLAHTDPARTEQAYGSFVDDLKRCDELGIGLYNFHPGNSVGSNRAAAIAHLAKNLNRAHAETKSVVTLLENMAAGGNVLGSTFEVLRDIIELVEDKSRVGVCLDTCHTFAAGYDLRSPAALEETMAKLDQTVGLKYLRAVHLNDSKAPLSSQRDLHANIGTGFLGLRAFHALVNDSRFHGLPMVLETPIDVRDDNGDLVKDVKGKPTEDKAIWAEEIKLLESLVDMDVESDEFRRLEESLQRKGAAERARVADQVERRKETQKKKKTKGRKADKEDTDDDSSQE